MKQTYLNVTTYTKSFYRRAVFYRMYRLFRTQTAIGTSIMFAILSVLTAMKGLKAQFFFCLAVFLITFVGMLWIPYLVDMHNLTKMKKETGGSDPVIRAEFEKTRIQVKNHNGVATNIDYKTLGAVVHKKRLYVLMPKGSYPVYLATDSFRNCTADQVDEYVGKRSEAIIR